VRRVMNQRQDNEACAPHCSDVSEGLRVTVPVSEQNVQLWRFEQRSKDPSEKRWPHIGFRPDWIAHVRQVELPTEPLSARTNLFHLWGINDARIPIEPKKVSGTPNQLVSSQKDRPTDTVLQRRQSLVNRSHLKENMLRSICPFQVADVECIQPSVICRIVLEYRSRRPAKIVCEHGRQFVRIQVNGPLYPRKRELRADSCILPFKYSAQLLWSRCAHLYTLISTKNGLLDPLACHRNVEF